MYLTDIHARQLTIEMLILYKFNILSIRYILDNIKLIITYCDVSEF
jgi:hypothetical protein